MTDHLGLLFVLVHNSIYDAKQPARTYTKHALVTGFTTHTVSFSDKDTPTPCVFKNVKFYCDTMDKV